MATWKGLVMAAAIALLVVAAPALAGREDRGEDMEKERARKVRTEKPSREKEAKSAIRGQYKTMCEWCALTPEQQAELEIRIKSRNEKLKAWKTEHAEAVKASRARMAEARKSGDEEAVKAARQESKALSESRKAVETECDAAILAVLNQDQRKAWEGYGLYRGVARSLKKVGLTAEQDKQIREMAAAAARTSAPAEEAGKKQGRGKAMKEFRADVVATVLTDEQKAKLGAGKPERAKKEKTSRKKPAREDVEPEA